MFLLSSRAVRRCTGYRLVMLKVYYMYVIAVFNNKYGVTGVDIITSEMRI